MDQVLVTEKVHAAEAGDRVVHTGRCTTLTHSYLQLTAGKYSKKRQIGFTASTF
jgi:hypothetical protein